MRYLRITNNDINNGDGVRVTLWISGCRHHCVGCHNEWTWDYNQGKDITECYNELKEKLSNNYVSGLTISGGDPLCQSEEDLCVLRDLIKHLKNEYPNKNIWLYTGYQINESLNKQQKEIIKLCDYVVDGPFILSEKDLTLAFRGSKNQKIWKIECDGSKKDVTDEF